MTSDVKQVRRDFLGILDVWSHLINELHAFCSALKLKVSGQSASWGVKIAVFR